MTFASGRDPKLALGVNELACVFKVWKLHMAPFSNSSHFRATNVSFANGEYGEF